MSIVRTIIIIMILYSLFDAYLLRKLMLKLHIQDQWFNYKLKRNLLITITCIALISKPIVVLSLITILLWVIVITKKLKKISDQRAIEYYGYKIFKFIINQVSSGILVSDAIQSMYLIVENSQLKRCLLKVSAYYAQTSDLENALNILRSSYGGIEVDTLCVAIEQGIHTGGQYETMLKMEELLFKKYINQIKRETEIRKKRGILAILFLSTVVILMIAIPLLLDMMKAFNQIFY